MREVLKTGLFSQREKQERLNELSLKKGFDMLCSGYSRWVGRRTLSACVSLKSWLWQPCLPIGDMSFRIGILLFTWGKMTLQISVTLKTHKIMNMSERGNKAIIYWSDRSRYIISLKMDHYNYNYKGWSAILFNCLLIPNHYFPRHVFASLHTKLAGFGCLFLTLGGINWMFICRPATSRNVMWSHTERTAERQEARLCSWLH